MNMRDDQPIKPQWPTPDLEWLDPPRPIPPPVPFKDVFSPRWSAWMRSAADAKGAPVDYVMGGLLAVLSSVLGNARWAAPWSGWAEPPVLWACLIGNPSAGKSPALDAVVGPLRKLEQRLREKARTERQDWEEQAAVAKIADATWKEEVKTALKGGEAPPERPAAAELDPEPTMPRLMVNDATIEKVATILAHQPRGLLVMRDELAGWLQGMTRYSGNSDRPFWLESNGGRFYAVERMGRPSVDVPHLTVAVLGGIQPDRLRSLLMGGGDDDGLLARFLPI